MKVLHSSLALAGLTVLAGIAFSTFSRSLASEPLTEEASASYWYQGTAELSRFHLEQSRYGETRAGDMVQVFVTEDFLPGPQVKMEHGDPKQRDAVSILKLNSLRKFTTGIYDYSMMRSSFVPMQATEEPQAIKLTASIQEWCGQVWLQMNRRGEEYDVERHSYFEDEADRSFKVSATWTEDELWTRIRVAPDLLPKGQVQMIPGSFALLLGHGPLRPEAAVVTQRQLDTGLDQVEVTYQELGRTLTITFERSFPHRIHSFIEKQTSGGRVFETRGTRTHLIMDDYWNHKALADQGLRQRLGLK